MALRFFIIGFLSPRVLLRTVYASAIVNATENSVRSKERAWIMPW